MPSKVRLRPTSICRPRYFCSLCQHLQQYRIESFRSLVLNPVSGVGEDVEGSPLLNILNIGADANQIRVQSDVAIAKDTVQTAG